MPRVLTFAALFAAIVWLPAPPASAQTLLLYDGFDDVHAGARHVRDVVEVKRSPLFDNAPFLRLRLGDKLVRAKEQFATNDKPVADPDRVGYYLCSNGKYYLLWTEERGGKLLLSNSAYSACACLLFDWDLTLDHARALRQLLAGHYVRSITTEQYRAIGNSLGQVFPGITVRPPFDIDIQPDQLISIPGQAVAEFQGIAYENPWNCLVRYTVKLGPHVCTVTGQVLVQGPPHVNRSEFEGDDYSGPNAGVPTPIDPETAKRKQAQFEAMTKFQNVVLKVIGP